MPTTTFTTVDGMMLHETRGGVESFYVPDPLGSLIQAKNTSGTVTYEATYWPYGEVRTETGTNPSSWGFVGLLGYLRDLVDLLYVRARYYRPKSAQWMTVDPMWPGQMAYGYVRQNAVASADPSGLIAGGPNTYDACLALFCSLKAGVDTVTALRNLFKGISDELWKQIKKLLDIAKDLMKKTPPPCDPTDCMKEIKNGLGLLGVIVRAICKYLKGDGKSLYACACAATSVETCKACCKAFGLPETGIYNTCYSACDNFEQIQQTRCGPDIPKGDESGPGPGGVPGQGCRCR
jgi:RHS repeat-associated protein